MSEERQENILVLDARPATRAVQSFSWDELPDGLNIADFDVVIMDLVPLMVQPDLATRVNQDSLPNPSQIMRQMRNLDSGAIIVIGGTPDLLLRRRGRTSFFRLGNLFVADMTLLKDSEFDNYSKRAGRRRLFRERSRGDSNP